MSNNVHIVYDFTHLLYIVYIYSENYLLYKPPVGSQQAIDSITPRAKGQILELIPNLKKGTNHAHNLG